MQTKEKDYKQGIETYPVEDFRFFNGKWMLINQKLSSFYDKDKNGQYSLPKGKRYCSPPKMAAD